MSSEHQPHRRDSPAAADGGDTLHRRQHSVMSDNMTVDSWGGGTQATTLTCQLQRDEQHLGLWYCPKHPECKFQDRNAMCGECERDFQSNRESLKERQRNVQERLQELSFESAGDILHDLQARMQQWKPPTADLDTPTNATAAAAAADRNPYPPPGAPPPSSQPLPQAPPTASSSSTGGAAPAPAPSVPSAAHHPHRQHSPQPPQQPSADAAAMPPYQQPPPYYHPEPPQHPHAPHHPHHAPQQPVPPPPQQLQQHHPLHGMPPPLTSPTAGTPLPPRHPAAAAPSPPSMTMPPNPYGAGAGTAPPNPYHHHHHPSAPMSGGSAPPMPGPPPPQYHQNPYSSPPPPSSSSLDALTLQMQRMQQMQDWMLWQKEAECQSLRQRLDEATVELQQLRVDNALLQEKLHQQDQRMQHELRLIKMAALRRRSSTGSGGGNANNAGATSTALVVDPKHLLPSSQPLSSSNNHQIVVSPSPGELGSAFPRQPSHDTEHPPESIEEPPHMAPTAHDDFDVGFFARATPEPSRNNRDRSNTSETTAHQPAQEVVAASDSFPPFSPAPAHPPAPSSSRNMINTRSEDSVTTDSEEGKDAFDANSITWPSGDSLGHHSHKPSSRTKQSTAYKHKVGPLTHAAAASSPANSPTKHRIQQHRPEADDQDDASVSSLPRTTQTPSSATNGAAAPQRDAGNNISSSSRSSANANGFHPAAATSAATANGTKGRITNLRQSTSNGDYQEEVDHLRQAWEVRDSSYRDAHSDAASYDNVPDLDDYDLDATSVGNDDDNDSLVKVPEKPFPYGTSVYGAHLQQQQKLEQQPRKPASSTRSTSSSSSSSTPTTTPSIGVAAYANNTSNGSAGGGSSAAPSNASKGVSFVDEDNASVGHTVASSTFGEDCYKVVNQTIHDPYGDKGTYTGVVLRSTGMPHGAGDMLYQEDKRVYSGQWRHGRWHGFGRAAFANGDKYEGMYRYDQRHGPGIYHWADGRVYDGEFREDKRHGRGKFLWPDGAVYEGEFRHGQREGHGSYIFSDGGRYEGSWKDGRYSGFGICSWEDGRCYKGEWLNGMAHGEGVETFADGTIRHAGLWREDEPLLET